MTLFSSSQFARPARTLEILRNSRPLLLFLFAALRAMPASAQAVAPSAIPVRAASASPAIGEEVLDANGVVASAEFVENRICTIKGCRVFIFDNRTGALILNDRVWAPVYAPTGRGGQVIRVLPFAASERPGPAPDDKALETAPGIIKVTRPAPPKSQ